MKKLIILLILAAVVLPVFAQDNKYSEQDIYYVNFPIEKIYPSRMGYIIQYRRSGTLLGTVGVPNEWFSHAAGKAEMINLPGGPNWPSMSVFYKDGEFSHVRIYVHRSKSHQTWGNLPQSTDVSGYFTDTETLAIKF